MAKKISNITQMDSDIVSMKKMIGDTDISSIGDGTLSGAINSIRNSSGNATESEDVKNLKTIVGDTDISKIADGTLTGAVNEAIDMVKNANTAKVFDTFAEMETWLKDVSNKGTLEVGSNLYIKESDISDYWVSGVLDSADDNTGYYYEIEELGAEKLDMSEYDEALGNLNSSVDNLESELSDIKTSVDEVKGMSSLITLGENIGSCTQIANLQDIKELDMVRCIKYLDGKFTVAASKTVGYSTDGVNWTLDTNATYQMDSTPNDILYGNGTYVFLNNYINYSTDGVNWTYVYLDGHGPTYGVYTGEKFVTISGSRKSCAHSEDGVTWTTHTGFPAISEMGMVYANNMFVSVGLGFNGVNVAYSNDGVTWTSLSITSLNGDIIRLQGIIYANNKFVATGYCDKSYLYAINSIDGITWDVYKMSDDVERSYHRAMAYGDGKFVVAASKYSYYQSDDGIIWVKTRISHNVSNDNIMYDMTYGDGKFIAVDDVGRVFQFEYEKIYTPINTSVSDLEARVAALENSSGSGDGTDITELQNTVEKLKTDVDDLSGLSDTVDELKKSVSDGKTLLAEAITGKGVKTASGATFKTMANNVTNISTGTKFYRSNQGNVRVSSGGTFKITFSQDSANPVKYLQLFIVGYGRIYSKFSCDCNKVHLGYTNQNDTSSGFGSIVGFYTEELTASDSFTITITVGSSDSYIYMSWVWFEVDSFYQYRQTPFGNLEYGLDKDVYTLPSNHLVIYWGSIDEEYVLPVVSYNRSCLVYLEDSGYRAEYPYLIIFRSLSDTTANPTHYAGHVSTHYMNKVIFKPEK